MRGVFLDVPKHLSFGAKGRSVSPQRLLELSHPLTFHHSARYNSVYSNAEAEIRESGLWDHRPSSDGFSAPYSQHHRSGSKASGLRNELDQTERNTSYNAERENYRDEEMIPGGSRYDGGYRNSIIAGQGQGTGYGRQEIPYRPQESRPNFVEPRQNEFDSAYQHPLR